MNLNPIIRFNDNDKYLVTPNYEKAKINELFNCDMDIGAFKNFSLKNNIPLKIQNEDLNYNNLIHVVINKNKLSEQKKLNLIKFFVNNSVNLDQPNRYNQRPIHFACKLQHKDIVTFLIKNGANCNQQDSYGYSPLHYLLNGKISNYKEKNYIPLVTPRKKNDISFSEKKRLEYKTELGKKIGSITELKNNIETETNNIVIKDLDKIHQLRKTFEERSKSLEEKVLFDSLKNKIDIIENKIIDKLDKMKFSNLTDNFENLIFTDYKNEFIPNYILDRPNIRFDNINYKFELDSDTISKEGISIGIEFISSSKPETTRLDEIKYFVYNNDDNFIIDDKYKKLPGIYQKDYLYVYKNENNFSEIKDQLNPDFQIFQLNDDDDKYLFDYETYELIFETETINIDDTLNKIKLDENHKNIFSIYYDIFKEIYTNEKKYKAVRYAFYFTLINNYLVPSMWSSLWSFINDYDTLNEEIKEKIKDDGYKTYYLYKMLEYYNENLMYARKYGLHYIGMLQCRYKKGILKELKDPNVFNDYVYPNEFLFRPHNIKEITDGSSNKEKEKYRNDIKNIFKKFKIDLNKILYDISINSNITEFMRIPILNYLYELIGKDKKSLNNYIRRINKLYLPFFLTNEIYYYYNGLPQIDSNINETEIIIYYKADYDLKTNYLFFNPYDLTKYPSTKKNLIFKPKNGLLEQKLNPVNWPIYKDIIGNLVTDLVRDIVGRENIKKFINEEEFNDSKFKEELTKNRKISIIRYIKDYVLDRVRFYIRKNIYEQIRNKLKIDQKLPEMDDYFADEELSLDIITVEDFGERINFFKQKFNFIENIKKRTDDDETVDEEKALFILYSEDYFLTDITTGLQEFKLNQNIFDELINSNSNIHLPDNQGNTPIFTIIKTNYYPIFEKIKDINFKNTFNKNMTLKNYLITDIKNHIEQFVSGDNFTDSVNSYSNIFHKDIKRYIKNDRNTFKNNTLKNLETGFKMCFTIILDHLNDQFIDRSTLTNNLLNNIPINDNFVIIKLLIEDFENRIEKRKKKYNENQEKIKSDKKIQTYDNIVYELKRKNKEIKKDITDPTDKKGIGKYNKIIGLLRHSELSSYIYIWQKNIFNNGNSVKITIYDKLNEILKNINGGKKIDDEDVDKFKEISDYCRTYFEERQFYGYNEPLKFTYKLLIHMTKVIIGEGVEGLITHLFYKFIKDNLKVSINDTIEIINNILKRKYIYKNESKSFSDIVKNEMSKILVINLSNMFENLSEEVNIERESSQDIIQNVFNLIAEDNLIPMNTEYLKKVFEEDIIFFLDGITKKCIKLWHSMVDNVFRFFIILHRKIKVYNSLFDKI